MSEPTLGIQKQDTFSSVVRKFSLVARYGRAMLNKIRRTDPNGTSAVDHELTPVPRAIPGPNESIPDVVWAMIAELIRNAGIRHVLVNFYSSHV